LRVLSLAKVIMWQGVSESPLIFRTLVYLLLCCLDRNRQIDVGHPDFW